MSTERPDTSFPPGEPPGPFQGHSPTDPGAAHAEPPETPDQIMTAATARLAELEAERDELRDKLLRAVAETENLRARQRRELDETRQYAVQKFARDVAEAADNLARGIASLPAARPDEPDIVARLREGFTGIERSFLGLLERNGITRVDPTGAAFDANYHQAMAEQELGGTSARDRAAGLDAGLAAERAPAAAGHGGRGQGSFGRAAGRPRPDGRIPPRHDGLSWDA